jgi:hypothetical protein
LHHNDGEKFTLEENTHGIQNEFNDNGGVSVGFQLNDILGVK